MSLQLTNIAETSLNQFDLSLSVEYNNPSLGCRKNSSCNQNLISKQKWNQSEISGLKLALEKYLPNFSSIRKLSLKISNHCNEYNLNKRTMKSIEGKIEHFCAIYNRKQGVYFTLKNDKYNTLLNLLKANRLNEILDQNSNIKDSKAVWSKTDLDDLYLLVNICLNSKCYSNLHDFSKGVLLWAERFFVLQDKNVEQINYRIMKSTSTRKAKEAWKRLEQNNFKIL
ncbi:MAG: hypothetical protein JHC93_06630 [Parachlamydiales bacterium]|nr:hypothetical protein [Parachlamydiales bacterium]